MAFDWKLHLALVVKKGVLYPRQQNADTVLDKLTIERFSKKEFIDILSIFYTVLVLHSMI